MQYTMNISTDELYSWLKTLPRKLLTICAISGSFFILLYTFQYTISNSIQFSKSSSFFTIFYILLFTIICYLLPKNIAKYIYSILYLFFFIIGIVQFFYYHSLYLPFGINDLFYAKEGQNYFYTLFSLINTRFICYIIFSLLSFFLTLYLIRTQSHSYHYDKYIWIGILGIFCIYSHYCAFWELGNIYTKSSTFYTNTNPRYIYDQFTNRLASFSITGLFEYTIRDISIYIKETFSYDHKQSTQDIEEYFISHHRIAEPNLYTGAVKDSNLIVILLESIDSWLVTNDTMPTLTYLKQTGLDFSNRYAPAFGGGRTFNTEYALNTGLYIPVNNYNIYNSVKNAYPQSLANQFKQNGYIANSIHMNSGKFYDRTSMHKTFGFDNHYALKDLKMEGMEDDRKLLQEEQVSSWIVPDKEPFVSYVITYSAHMPYIDNKLCQTQEEWSCIKELAHITDTFLKDLLIKLENQGKLDNTTLVLVSDHYAYGYQDTEQLLQKKQVSSLLDKEIEKVPFIVWNTKLEPKTIDTIMGTNDILPTILNLYGFPYDPNQYIGNDLFSKNASNFTYFNDYTWKSNHNDYLYEEVKKRIEVNDNIIKTDYFRTQ